MSRLQDELRKRFSSPQAALRAMGLPVELLEPREWLATNRKVI